MYRLINRTRGLFYGTTVVKSLVKFTERELRLRSYVAKVIDRPVTLLEKDCVSGSLLCILQNFLEQILYRISMDTTFTYRFLHSVQLQTYTNKSMLLLFS